MAADLDRTGQGRPGRAGKGGQDRGRTPGGAAGRAGVIQAGREFLQVRDSCRSGQIFLQHWRVLSFLDMLLSFFDDLVINS